MKKVMVIVGSVRQGRFAGQLLPYVQKALKQHQNISVDIADLKEVHLPFFNDPVPPMSPSFTPDDPEAIKWNKRVADADGFIFMTPEYNHSTSAVLKNAIDWVYEGWVDKPVAFVAWGVEGGVRAVEHLRQIVLLTLMRPLRTASYISVLDAFDQDGRLLDQGVPRRIEQTVAELIAALETKSTKKQL